MQENHHDFEKKMIYYINIGPESIGLILTT